MASSRRGLQDIARRAMLARGFLPAFEAPVLAELKAITGPASAPGSSVRDLRELLWMSIDNDDSLDLDQLSVATPLEGGTVKVLVAIADVDALVKKATPIDAHAQHNTTSVYTPAEVFPMLPERLSTDLTSLAEGQERLALVIEMSVHADGAVGGADIYRAMVLNHGKLAYNSTAAWLTGQGAMPARVAAVPGLAEQLRLQDGVAQVLKTRRSDHGALTLRTIEPRAVFDGDLLTDLRSDPQNRAEALIEDLMIAANGAAVQFLEARGMPTFHRVLRVPDRWDRIVALAAGVGERLPPTPDAVALEAFLMKRQQADPLRFPDLSLSVVKLLGSGEYVVDVPGQQTEGHFALAVTGYTHATAPNRRFPDLVSQRLLKAAMEGGSVPYSLDELRSLAARCTEMEDNAKKVERQVRKSAAALLLRGRAGERFDALVTGVSEKGTWVRIFQPPAEGKVVRGFQGLNVGDRVAVELVGADVERGFIDFARAERTR